LIRVAIDADHGGFDMKTQLNSTGGSACAGGAPCVDFGNKAFDPNGDYPDFAIPLARSVAEGQVDRVVLVCGSGVGASVAANKINGVRAALIHDNYSARQGRTTGVAVAWACVQNFLSAQFSGAEGHRRRLAKVEQAERALPHPRR